MSSKKVQNTLGLGQMRNRKEQYDCHLWLQRDQNKYFESVNNNNNNNNLMIITIIIKNWCALISSPNAFSSSSVLLTFTFIIDTVAVNLSSVLFTNEANNSFQTGFLNNNCVCSNSP